MARMSFSIRFGVDRIKICRRFVQKEDFGPGDQRPCDCHTLHLPSGERNCFPVRKVQEPDDIERLMNT